MGNEIYTDQNPPEEGNKVSTKFNLLQFIVLCMGTATQNMIVTGASSAAMSSVEKAFQITSFHVGIYISIYNIFLAFSSIPLTYLATVNQMRIINYGMILISFGAFLVITPVLTLNQNLESSASHAYLCSKKSKILSEAPKVQLQIFTLICFGYALIGVGSAPFYNISYNFIYDKFDKKKTSTYIAIYMICGISGGACIYLFSRIVLQIPIHPWTKESVLTDPANENFVGAYWILYLVGAVLMLLAFSLSKILNCIYSNGSESKKVCL